MCLGDRGFIVPDLHFHVFELGVVEMKTKSKRNGTAPSLSIAPSGRNPEVKAAVLNVGQLTHRGVI